MRLNTAEKAQPRMTPTSHPLCRKCEYDLHGLAAGICPECGARFDPNDAATYRIRKRRRFWKPLLAVAIVASLAGLAWKAKTSAYSVVSKQRCLRCGAAAAKSEIVVLGIAIPKQPLSVTHTALSEFVQSDIHACGHVWEDTSRREMRPGGVVKDTAAFLPSAQAAFESRIPLRNYRVIAAFVPELKDLVRRDLIQSPATPERFVRLYLIHKTPRDYITYSFMRDRDEGERSPDRDWFLDDWEWSGQAARHAAIAPSEEQWAQHLLSLVARYSDRARAHYAPSRPATRESPTAPIDSDDAP